MSPDKLIYMANQIGKFFTSQGLEQAAAGTADHIKKFWDPRMRAAILTHLEAGGAGLDPVVRVALERLTQAKPEPREPKTHAQ
ncbi:MAG TPA: formate dehydrogenase subunit delta [Xanthobacteraceae bacterium]|nr:formate dehydrogenase subunit delta [Xanthobacteraceae bacterium]